ncbi:MAG: N(4)-(beta-N-acetylglucosaminyl)-L-asparaginase [Gemmatimonadetes bacterium]|nr:N(4)-(beta-N-acetylglucosaminyl)-L-asparaginase [Gemmatimonadota bacterium]
MATRRQFVRRVASAGAGVAAGVAVPGGWLEGAPAVHARQVRPVAISSANGLRAVARAMEVLEGGGEPVEAVVSGVNIVELDPEDTSVGYGGLPNYEGVVQLDASVMNGPTRGAGAVAALEGIKTPSRVALAVMRYTDHVLLVGEGAQRFAVSMGFKVEDLLTEKARERWLEWRAGLNPDDDYLEPKESGDRVERFPVSGAAEPGMLDSYDGERPWGTINCNAIDRDGNLAGVTTTSGLAFKLPGRVGDSPLVGAGLYVDNDVGACGSTGRGEAVINVCGSHTVVELMRAGMSPQDAALEGLRRILRWTVEKRLLDEQGRPAFNVNFYALNKRGETGGAALWPGSRFAVSVDGEARLEDAAYLFER